MIGKDEWCQVCGGPMIPFLDMMAGRTTMTCQNRCIPTLREDEPVELGPWLVDESTLSGQVIAEIVDLPWYVALFWIVVGMVFMSVVVFILLLLWTR